MEFRARLSLRADCDDVVHDLCVDLRSLRPDLAVFFASHHHGPDFTELVRGIYDRANARILIGCTGESIIGPTAEIEHQPAAALWVAKLPGVRVFPFVLDQEDLANLKDPEAWHDRLGVTPDQQPSFITLPEPYSINVEAGLQAMDEHFPGSTIVGGMASGATGPEQNRLFLNDQTLRRGLVGVALTGNISLSAVVSQGCRPVGDRFVVTKSRDNLIEELGGRPALEILQEVYMRAGSVDQELMRQGIHVGRLINAGARAGPTGEFLIRNMMGVFENRALAVGDFFRPGQTVQFHLRDAQSADEEMQRLLQAQPQSPPASGGLLFTCNGRGRRFFTHSNHDIALINDVLADCPTIGFFAQGEIGPIGQRTFIHGYTSSLVLFRDKQPPAPSSA